MPTISSGNSATIALPAGQRIKFSAGGDGTAVVTGAGVDVPYSLANGAEIGPFTQARSVSVSAVRAVTYAVQALPVATVQQDAVGAITGQGSQAVAFAEVTPIVNMTATGTAFTGACELAGFDCTVAAGNITIYDGTSAAGTVIVPTQALAVGRIEFLYKRALVNGCHVVLSGAATVNVLVG